MIINISSVNENAVPSAPPAHIVAVKKVKPRSTEVKDQKFFRFSIGTSSSGKSCEALLFLEIEEIISLAIDLFCEIQK